MTTLFGLSPIALQLGAAWLLVLALLMAREDQESAPARAASPVPDEYDPICPFCGVRFVDHRPCWCGSDGHWF